MNYSIGTTTWELHMGTIHSEKLTPQQIEYLCKLDAMIDPVLLKLDIMIAAKKVGIADKEAFDAERLLKDIKL